MARKQRWKEKLALKKAMVPLPPEKQYVFLADDLYTPLTTEVKDLIRLCASRYETWDIYCRLAGVRVRVVNRYLREGPVAVRGRRRKAVAQKTLDRLLTTGGEGHRITDFPWYTIEELVEQGIWRPAYDVGQYAIKKRERKRAQLRKRVQQKTQQEGRR